MYALPVKEEPVDLRVPETQVQTVERKWAAMPPEKLRLHLAALAIEEYELLQLPHAPASSSDAASSSASTNS